MLKIDNLKINVGEKEILAGISMSFESGKNYLILGKNGSGKSSLANTLVGNPKYEYISGKITIDNNDLLSMSVSDRSLNGLFLSFQNVPEIAGVNLREYLRIIYNNKIKTTPDFAKSGLKEVSPFLFKRFIKKYLDELNIPENFLDRDLNVGFSGGEKRKIELLQAKLLNPKYIILDEIDSGLDIDAFKTVASLIKELDSPNNSIIIITHQFKILEYLNFDKVYVMKDGRIQKEGGIEVIDEITKNGF